MTDAILQRVVADLKPLILAKWRDEEPYRSSSGPQAKKFGIVDVHRGDTYQVAYFLQKNNSHNLLIKSRYFVARPPTQYMPSVAKDPNTLDTSSRATSRKRGNPKPVKQGAKPQPKPKKRKRKDDSEEEAESTGTDEEDANIARTGPIGTRRSTRTRGGGGIAPGVYREDDMNDEDDEREDHSSTRRGDAEERDTEMEDRTANDLPLTSATDTTRVKAEINEEGILSVLSGTIPMASGGDADNTQVDESSSHDQDNSMLVAEDAEEEEKPKPDLSLRYAGYTIPDVCLAIIVEPWKDPSWSRAGTREPSVIPTGPGADVNRSRFVGVVASAPAREETEPLSDMASSPGSRAKTPLFREFTPMPEAGPSTSASFSVRPLAPQTFGRTLPRVPLFHESTPAPDEDGFFPTDFGDEAENGTTSIMQFSQAMNLGGTKSSGFGNGDEGDEDDLDVFLADADEAR
ncbi:hypothetical protein FRB97_002991 [Tulasnella sp. 331]|nr:hypothetical protein FRB97_002991 [Tulasnella sp. 331]